LLKGICYSNLPVNILSSNHSKPQYYPSLHFIPITCYSSIFIAVHYGFFLTGTVDFNIIHSLSFFSFPFLSFLFLFSLNSPSIKSLWLYIYILKFIYEFVYPYLYMYTYYIWSCLYLSFGVIQILEKYEIIINSLLQRSSATKLF
jgi:hypothetical protein